MAFRDLTAEELAGATFFNPSQGLRPITPEEEEGATFFEKPAPISKLRSLLSGGAQGLTLGLSDEATGVLGGLAGLTTGEGFGPAFRREQQAAEAETLAARQANPATFGAGALAGAAAPLLLTGGAAAPAAGAGTAARIGLGAARGAALGGTTAAGTSERTIGEEGFASDVLAGTAAGALVGGGIPGAGAALSATGRGLKAVGTRAAEKAGGLLPLFSRGAEAAATTAGAAINPLLAAPAGLFARRGIQAITPKVAKETAKSTILDAAGRPFELLARQAARSVGRTTGDRVRDIITGGAASAAATQATPAEKFVASETSEKFRVQSMKKAEKDFEKEQRRLERAR